MTGTPSTTTPPEAEKADFTQPEREIDEEALLRHLSRPITADSFSALITSNFLVVMDAYDHRCKREYFQDIVVNAFNLQNRLVRIAELKSLQEVMDPVPDSLKGDIDRHMASAMEYKKIMIQTLRLLREMRTPEDPVS
jgi:hypothetical protein